MKLFRLTPQRVWPLAINEPVSGGDVEDILRQQPMLREGGVGHPEVIVVAGAHEWETRLRGGASSEVLDLVVGELSEESRRLMWEVLNSGDNVALFAESSDSFAFKGEFFCELVQGQLYFTPALPSGPVWVDVSIRRPTRFEARLPFEVDPDELDRKRREHHEVVRALVEMASARGLAVCRPNSVPIDVGWFMGSRVGEGDYRLVEVKTVTPSNADKQLRLAIAQVLHYETAIELAELVQPGCTRRQVVLVGDSGPLAEPLLALLRKLSIELCIFSDSTSIAGSTELFD